MTKTQKELEQEYEAKLDAARDRISAKEARRITNEIGSKAGAHLNYFEGVAFCERILDAHGLHCDGSGPAIDQIVYMIAVAAIQHLSSEVALDVIHAAISHFYSLWWRDAYPEKWEPGYRRPIQEVLSNIPPYDPSSFDIDDFEY